MALTNLESGVTKIAAGFFHGLAIKNGGVFSWGSSQNGGLLGDGTFFGGSSTPQAVGILAEGVTDIAAGTYHNLAVKNGQVYVWGSGTWLGLGEDYPYTLANILEMPVAIPNVTNVIDVEVGESSSYALTADGNLWVWGKNEYGELGLGDTQPHNLPTYLAAPEGYRYTSISPGLIHVVATLTAVPEPSSVTVLAITGVGLSRRRR